MNDKDVYNPAKPYCLKHGYIHWTKDCEDLKESTPHEN